MTASSLPPVSLRTLARLTRLDRDYILRRIEGIQPAGTRSGHPVFNPADVLPALCRPGTAGTGGPVDVSLLSPADRRHHFDAELKALELRRRAGELCELDEVMQLYTTTIAVFAEQIRSVPDILERKAGITPKQAETAADEIDEQLEQIRSRLMRRFGE